MMKIAVLDLDGDGQVANNEARAERAKAIASQEPSKKYWDVFYGVLFQPDLVDLDTLQPGADQAIAALRQQGYYIILLTSRPEYMRQATEAWLSKHGLTCEVMMVMKDYGTNMDPRDRFVKTKIWKAKKVREIWDDMLPDTMLFIDDQEENREAVADIGNPRIVVKYSLQDAMETDLQHYPQHSPNASELLRFVESLVNAACVHHRFESDEKFLLRVEHKPVTGQEYRPMPLVVRAANKGEQRFVSVTEMMPLKDGRETEALTIAMNAREGQVVDVVMAELTGGETPIIEPTEEEIEDAGTIYEHPFVHEDPAESRRMMEGFASWKAKNLREFLYVEAAKYQREARLWEMRAAMEYAAAIEEVDRKLRAAFQGMTQERKDKQG